MTKGRRMIDDDDWDDDDYVSDGMWMKRRIATLRRSDVGVEIL
jgi:hypothetical protein